MQVVYVLIIHNSQSNTQHQIAHRIDNSEIHVNLFDKNNFPNVFNLWNFIRILVQSVRCDIEFCNLGSHLYLFEWYFKSKWLVVIGIQCAFLDARFLLLEAFAILHECYLYVRICWVAAARPNMKRKCLSIRLVFSTYFIYLQRSGFPNIKLYKYNNAL